MFTTETQRHRDNQEKNDPRSNPSLARQSRFTVAKVQDYWNRHTRNAYATNCIWVESNFNFNVPLLVRGITRRIIQFH
jgi:hypothetical protein